MKILCLGNEFIKEDSLAKEIGRLLSKEGYETINVKDSFELVNYLHDEEDFIVLDVVEGLEEVRLVKVEDLKESKIITAHDFDAGFFLKLLGDKNKKKIKIIGIPINGDCWEIFKEVRKLLISYI